MGRENWVGAEEENERNGEMEKKKKRKIEWTESESEWGGREKFRVGPEGKRERERLWSR